MDDGLADHRAAPHDEVEHAGRQARAAEDVRQRPAAARHQIGRLEQHAVAVRERGRDLPGGNRDREIPGGDQDRKSTRLNSSHTVISYAVFCLKKKNTMKYLYTARKIQLTHMSKAAPRSTQILQP